MAEARNTMQKDIVASTLKKMHNHPTADAVYLTLHEEFPSISKATVYRILNQMAENGTALKIPIPNAADRFDDTFAPHYHVRCTACGAVDDITGINIPLPHIPRENACGFLVKNAALYFEGLCPACEDRPKAEPTT